LQHRPLRQRDSGDRLNNAKGVTKLNNQPQVNKYFADGHCIYLLAEGRLVNRGCATGHRALLCPTALRTNAFAQLDLWQKKDTTSRRLRLPKKLDEKGPPDLEKIGRQPHQLCENKLPYLDVPIDGPYKRTISATIVALITIYSAGLPSVRSGKGGHRALRQTVDFAVEIIDISQNPELLERYRDDIPVILLDGHEMARHFVLGTQAAGTVTVIDTTRGGMLE